VCHARCVERVERQAYAVRWQSCAFPNLYFQVSTSDRVPVRTLIIKVSLERKLTRPLSIDGEARVATRDLTGLTRLTGRQGRRVSRPHQKGEGLWHCPVAGSGPRVSGWGPRLQCPCRAFIPPPPRHVLPCFYVAEEDGDITSSRHSSAHIALAFRRQAQGRDDGVALIKECVPTRRS
jgi:hypothetical protein